MKLEVCSSVLWAAVAMLGGSVTARAEIVGGAFTKATIDPQGFVATGVSVAAGSDGLPLVAYSDPVGEGRVRLAHCDDPACSSATLTALPPLSGQYPSLVTGPDGRPLLSHTSFGGRLLVTHCNDAACTASTTADVDQSTGATSITIGADGRGLVLYTVPATSPGGPLVLKVAHCDDASCTSATATVLAQGELRASVIAVGADGLGVAAYQDAFAFTVNVAHCANTACTSATTRTVDGARGGFGLETAGLAVGTDGLALVAYQDAVTGQPKVAHCSDATCATSTKTIVDDAEGTSIALARGSDGLALVAYNRYPTGGDMDIRVLHCTDVLCSSATATTAGTGFGTVAVTVGADDHPLVAVLGGPLLVLHQATRGDFGVDGRPDLVWRRDATGENLVWFMNGAELLSATYTNPAALADTRWRLVGTSDFNNDAQTDLLWRHSFSGQNVFWLMNGVTLTSGTFTTPLADTRWNVGGTGDFNLDGRPDILWRHGFSGENVVWYMNGTSLVSGTFVNPSLPDTNWTVAGVADFNRDGQQDILWHHGVSGQVVLWYMNGATLASGTFTNPPALAHVRWQNAAVGDYDSNGNPDLVWHNDFSGQTVVWFMNGANLVAGTFTNPSTFPDTNWKLVGPR
jgi:hypothetical protein